MFRTLLMVVGVAAAAAPASLPDGLEDDATAVRFLGGQTRITRNQCTCSPRTESCTCCGRIDQFSADLHRIGCATVRHGRGLSRDLRYDFTLDDRTVTKTESAGVKNPSELCIPAAFLTICTRFFNVEFENAAFTFCFRLDVKYSKFTLLAVDFDCVRVMLVPGIQGNPPQGTGGRW